MFKTMLQQSFSLINKSNKVFSAYEGTLPSPKETVKGNIKTVTEYKIDEDGKKVKVRAVFKTGFDFYKIGNSLLTCLNTFVFPLQIVRTFKIETRKASKAVARRKVCWFCIHMYIIHVFFQLGKFTNLSCLYAELEKIWKFRI